MGLGSWILCSFMAVNNHGETRNYMMPAQIKLEANDGVHYWVDFSYSLAHNGFDPRKNKDTMKLVNYKQDCALKYDRYTKEEEKNELTRYPENH